MQDCNSYRSFNGASFGSEAEDEFKGIFFDVVRVGGVSVSVSSQISLQPGDEKKNCFLGLFF